MEIETYFFAFLNLLIVFSLLVVFSSHPIFSLLFLVISFLLASFLLFMLECEFLALIFITVYVGAIAILFLFSIMMLDFKRHTLQKNLLKVLPTALIFGFFLLIPLINTIYLFFPSIPNNNFYIEYNINWFEIANSKNELEALGQVLYTSFALHLLLIGIILLVVLFGVVHLTSTEKTTKKASQIIFKQLAKNTKLKIQKNA